MKNLWQFEDKWIELMDHFEFEMVISNFQFTILKSHTSTSRSCFLQLKNCIYGISSTLSGLCTIENRDFSIFF